jgi:two-component sensor histidine kinase
VGEGLVSSFLTNAIAARPRAAGERDETLEVDFRTAAVQAGYRLGFASLVVVLAGLAVDGGVRHRGPLAVLTVAAAAANTAAMVVPWRDWLVARRGRVLLDVWCGGLIAYVAVLVVEGSSNFALLLFLTIPFIAVAQVGWRRGFWLAAGAATCVLVAALAPLPAGATAMRAALVAAAVAVALVLARTVRDETAAHMRASSRAELERTLAKEASHRIKNDLQTVADLLLLGRPDGGSAAFDEAAARIRSVATVHRLLTEADDRIDAHALLHSIARRAPVPVAVEAESVALDAVTAQRLGIVANELITNAFQHGAPPIVVRLSVDEHARLRVDDGGHDAAGAEGLGLELVRQIAEHGLRGRFEFSALPGGGSRAEVVFPAVPR